MNQGLAWRTLLSDGGGLMPFPDLDRSTRGVTVGVLLAVAALFGLGPLAALA